MAQSCHSAFPHVLFVETVIESQRLSDHEKEIQKKAEKPLLCGLKQCLSRTHEFDSLDLGKGRLSWNAQECHGTAGAVSGRLGRQAWLQ